MSGIIKVMLEHFDGDQREEFEGIVRESFAEIEKGRIIAGVRRLERAAAGEGVWVTQKGAAQKRRRMCGH